MSGPFYGASQDRLLAILPQGTVASVLAEHADRPIAALLTSHDAGHQSRELEAAIVSLLDAGCDYFVCFGSTSEGLHDHIDHVALAVTSTGDRTVMTTWHDNEPAADVADFFFNVAGVEDGTLLVALLGPEDKYLSRLLIERASQR